MGGNRALGRRPPVHPPTGSRRRPAADTESSCGLITIAAPSRRSSTTTPSSTQSGSSSTAGQHVHQHQHQHQQHVHQHQQGGGGAHAALPPAAANPTLTTKIWAPRSSPTQPLRRPRKPGRAASPPPAHHMQPCAPSALLCPACQHRALRWILRSSTPLQSRARSSRARVLSNSEKVGGRQRFTLPLPACPLYPSVGAGPPPPPPRARQGVG